MTLKFDHEKLRVYQASLEFVSWSTELLGETSAKAAVKDQLDRASTSVPLNLAEGNAKWSVADRLRYLRTAMGSTMECAACLDVFVAKRLCEGERVAEGKELLAGMASMLVGLMHSLDGRIAEESLLYKGENEDEDE
jgi:four helix bundle protein